MCMVSTRSQLKVEIKKFVNKQKIPFKTVTVQQYAKDICRNVKLSPHRLQNYIRRSNKVKFDKNSKIWIPIKNVKNEMSRM